MNPNQPQPQAPAPTPPLKRHHEEQPRPAATTRYPWLRDVAGLLLFIIAVVAGAALINQTVFRSFAVIGPSMEDTLYTGERIVVNRLPVTGANILLKDYVPKRGQIVVFKNPQFRPGDAEEFIVKRVVAFAGETVDVAGCEIRIFNQEHPDGFDPYKTPEFKVSNPNDCVSGEVDRYTVPEGELFVIGDHRNGQYSHDSRDGIGNGESSNRKPAGIPLPNVVGPVSMRIMPVADFRFF